MAQVAQLRLEDEYDGSTLGDVRRQRRLTAIAVALADDPAASFPKAMKTHAALEGSYRLLRNDAVTMDGILAGHFAQTAERASAHGLVLALHDTTDFKFSGEESREGLGPLRGNGQGFFGHFTLVVTADELRKPLGVIALQTIVRERAKEENEKSKQPTPGQTREAARWKKGAELTEERLGEGCNVIHVMDREGDSYDLWADLMMAGRRFVTRISKDRVLSEAVHLSDVVAAGKVVVERKVHLSRRRKEKIVFNRKRHPARAGRLARLQLSAQTVTFPRPSICSKSLPETLTVNIVHVAEIGTNGSEPPVDWLLVTTEPIASVEDIERIVDIYRARWVIEEYFKALKTGCDYEKRQFESDHTLFNALALLVPIAWRLLLLRALSRDLADAPATEALTKTQIDVLVATSSKALSHKLTVREAMLAVARLGGHITNNGHPGWIVLGRGFEHLLLLEKGWKAAKRRDQS